MTTKPVMKTPTAISCAFEESGYMSFWASPDAAQEFEQFGNLYKSNDNSSKYSLYVDGRFDFDEVLAYIKNYC